MKALKRLNLVKAAEVNEGRKEIRFNFLSGGIDVELREYITKTEDAMDLSVFSSHDNFKFIKVAPHNEDIFDNLDPSSPEYKEAVKERKAYIASENSKALKEVADAVNKFEKDIIARMKKLGYKLGKEKFGI